MSGTSVSNLVEDSVQRVSRTATFHEKIEEARARRASILTPRPVSVGLSVPETEEREREPVEEPAIEPSAPRAETVRVAFLEEPKNEKKYEKGSALKWTIRSLTILLIALVATAAYQIRGSVPNLPVPVVLASVADLPGAAPVARSGALSRVSQNDFPPLRFLPTALPAATFEARPMVSAPLTNASVAPEADLQVAPSNIVTLSGNIRPLGRPDSLSAPQAAN